MKNKLQSNLYNQSRSRTETKFKLWSHAGIMLTYKCSAACEFCYYHCSPHKNGLIPAQSAISIWKSLKKLAPETAKVHLTGGEPFLYYDRLVEILTLASREQLTPLDLLETNASWATERSLIKNRLEELDSLGLEKLKISFDPFHAEYIDRENVITLAEIAKEILGPERTMVRWEKYLDPDFIPSEKIPREERLRQALLDDPCRFTGKASKMLAQLAPQKTIEDLACQNCADSFRNAKGVHIDPLGNVFSGQCSGIVIGNVNETDLDQLWEHFDPSREPLIETLFHRGPAGLMDMAVEHGYAAKPTYASKCHLCSDIRQFFFDINLFPKIIAPSQCYETSNSHNTEKNIEDAGEYERG